MAASTGSQPRQHIRQFIQSLQEGAARSQKKRRESKTKRPTMGWAKPTRINYSIAATTPPSPPILCNIARLVLISSLLRSERARALIRPALMLSMLVFVFSIFILFAQSFASYAVWRAMRFDDPLKVRRYLLNNFETCLKRTFSSVRTSTCTRAEILLDVDFILFSSSSSSAPCALLWCVCFFSSFVFRMSKTHSTHRNRRTHVIPNEMRGAKQEKKK